MISFLVTLINGCSEIDQLANQVGQLIPANLTAINFQVNGGSETVSIDNTGASTGESINLRVTVRNQGAGTSLTGIVRYYRSDDSTINTNDTEVGMDNFDALLINTSSIEETTVTTPTITGTYYYGACVDVQNGESDTEDNCSSAVRVDVSGSPPPDLIAENFTINGGTSTVNATTSGINLDLAVTVRNQGPSTSSAGVVKYYRSVDSVISTNDTEIGEDSFSGLTFNEIYAQQISVNALTNTGTYYYGACVDAQSNEGNTGNNCSDSVQVNVSDPSSPPSSAVDLAIFNFTINGSNREINVTSGTTNLDLAVTIRNQGEAGNLVDVIRYYRSDDSTITTNDVEIGINASTNYLAANGTVDKQTYSFAPTSPGTYYYGACVAAQKGENNTANNCSYAIRVNVSDPSSPPISAVDLAIFNFTINGSNREINVTSGTTNLDLAVTITNESAVDSSSGVVRYYRSDNTSISTSDTEVGVSSFTDLAANELHSGGIFVTSPTRRGTYYYGACVDVQSRESDSSNNCSPVIRVEVRIPVLTSNLSDATAMLVANVPNRRDDKVYAYRIR